MLCDVCGRDNPDRLLYCQDCGKRLKAPAQKGVTPQAGIPATPGPVPAAPPSAPAPPQPTASGSIPPADGSPRRSRPEAPPFSFAPPAAPAFAPASPPIGSPALAPAPVPAAQPVQPQGASTTTPDPGGTVCPICASENPPLYRFCAVCGGTLPKSPASLRAPTAPQPSGSAAPAAPQPAPVAGAPSAKPGPTAGEPIVPAQVVQIADPAIPRVTVFPCSRCQGQNDGLARFCKYCGAPMGGVMTPSPPAVAPAQAVAPAPAPAPTAAPTPPAAPPRVPAAPTPAPPRPVAQDPVPVPVPAAQPIAPTPGLGLVARAPAAEAAPQARQVVAPVPAQVPPAPAPTPGPIAGSSAKSVTAEKTGPHPLVRASEIAAKLRAAAPPSPSRPGMAAAAPSPSDTVQTRAPDQRNEAPTVGGRLVVVVEDGSDGKAFDLVGPEVVVGRTEGDVLLFDDPYVSPRHAKLTERGGQWRIHDLRSTNGVYLRARGRQPIESGDLILLGSQVLQFQLVSEEERQLTPAVQHGTRVFGTKPSTRLARLDQRSVTGLVGDVYYVTRDETILGRETGDLVFTSDAFLSRRHAALRRDPISNRFHLEDLDSSNGTYVAINGETLLQNGDRVRVGQHLFRFETGS